jgi:predicted transcriptional regulator
MPEVTLEQPRKGRKLSTKMLVEIRASLTETDWRLLHWLLRYPLQRADDLGIGVARWASRATVYRHMQGLEAKGLVESVLPKTPGTGKWLYHLSNLGLHLLAWHLEEPPRELARCF